MYAKHTNFALEPKEVPFSAGTPNYGSRHTDVTILRHGDLVTKMWLFMKVAAVGNSGGTVNVSYEPANDNGSLSNDFGRAFIEEYQINIGSVVFDKRTGVYMHIWEELSRLRETQYGRLTGKTPVNDDLKLWANEDQIFYIPIDAWFTEDRANGLPIVALYQHDVRINFQFRNKLDLVKAAQANYLTVQPEEAAILQINMIIEYAFLENHERNWFSGGHHEYLINQVQFVGSTPLPLTAQAASSIEVPITFNHPTKELIIVFRKNSEVTAKEYFNFEGFEGQQKDCFSTMRLLLNSSDKFTARDNVFFRVVQPIEHHTRKPDKHVYVYSFALWPEKPDPTGSINFSRIDNAALRFEFATARTEDMEILIFARNLNIARIRNGMSHLSYA